MTNINLNNLDALAAAAERLQNYTQVQFEGMRRAQQLADDAAATAAEEAGRARC